MFQHHDRRLQERGQVGIAAVDTDAAATNTIRGQTTIGILLVQHVQFGRGDTNGLLLEPVVRQRFINWN